jgi:hypothetical protein
MLKTKFNIDCKPQKRGSWLLKNLYT